MQHWGPDCKLMSRARGKPIQLNSGGWIEGPKALRSDRYPLAPHIQARFRKSNAMFRSSFRIFHLRLRNLGVAVIEHPVRSFGWNFPEAMELSNSNGSFFIVPELLLRGGEAEVYSFLAQLSPPASRNS